MGDDLAGDVNTRDDLHQIASTAAGGEEHDRISRGAPDQEQRLNVEAEMGSSTHDVENVSTGAVASTHEDTETPGELSAESAVSPTNMPAEGCLPQPAEANPDQLERQEEVEPKESLDNDIIPTGLSTSVTERINEVGQAGQFCFLQKKYYYCYYWVTLSIPPCMLPPSPRPTVTFSCRSFSPVNRG
jgi:hypothetical protein